MNSRIAIIILTFLINVPLKSQTFEYKSYSNQDEVVANLIQMEDHYVFVGLIRENIDSLYNSYLFVLNESGELLHELIYDSDPFKNNSLEEILPLNDSIFYTVGDCWQPGNYYNGELKLLKINIDLQILSEYSFPFPIQYGILSYKAKYDLDSNILVYGHAYLSTPPLGRRHMFIYKVSQYGDSLLAKIFTEEPFSSCDDIRKINNAQYYAIATGFGNGLYAKYLIIDSAFNIDSVVYPEYTFSYYASTQWDSDTSYYYTNESNYGSIAPDHSIAVVHQRIFDTNYFFNYWDDSATYIDVPCIKQGISFTNKDSIFVGGTNNQQIPPWFGGYPSNYILFQTDSLLNIRWEQKYGGDAYYELNTIKATNDGGCILAGTRYDYTNGNQERDLYILKVNKEGLLVSTTENPAINNQPCLIYPNPGKGILNITSSEDNLHIQLFDLTGRVLFTGPLAKGINSLSLQGFPSGIFIYRIFDQKSRLIQGGKWVKVE